MSDASEDPPPPHSLSGPCLIDPVNRLAVWRSTESDPVSSIGDILEEDPASMSDTSVDPE